LPGIACGRRSLQPGKKIGGKEDRESDLGEEEEMGKKVGRGELRQLYNGGWEGISSLQVVATPFELRLADFSHWRSQLVRYCGWYSNRGRESGNP